MPPPSYSFFASCPFCGHKWAEDQGSIPVSVFLLKLFLRYVACPGCGSPVRADLEEDTSAYHQQGEMKMAFDAQGDEE